MGSSAGLIIPFLFLAQDQVLVCNNSSEVIMRHTRSECREAESESIVNSGSKALWGELANCRRQASLRRLSHWFANSPVHCATVDCRICYCTAAAGRLSFIGENGKKSCHCVSERRASPAFARCSLSKSDRIKDTWAFRERGEWTTHTESDTERQHNEAKTVTQRGHFWKLVV